MYKRDRGSSEQFMRPPSSYPQRRKTPSFSSSLLEAIYRSIDESDGHDEYSAFYGEALVATRKQSTRGRYDRNAAPCLVQKGFSSLERAIMIEEWMEKQSSRGGRCGSLRMNSASSSSGSSSGGRTAGMCSFSSSETESSRHKHRSRHKLPVPDDNHRKKIKDRNDGFGGGFSRTRLGALKIYGELKKVKQPISPGGKISSFLNSIFNSRNVKKAKMCYVGAADDVRGFDRKGSSSSVSSFSRSCVSKTPSTRKNNYDISTDHSSSKQSKRLVRSYPLGVVVGENSEPCGYQQVLKSCSSYKENDFSKTKKDWGSEFGLRGGDCGDDRVDEEDDHRDRDDDDGALSCASSDLFELDHLIGRYREDLPVYETTNLKRNQAIANGFIL